MWCHTDHSGGIRWYTWCVPELDAQRAQELRIEEQFPDGKAGSGFSYTFSLTQLPEKQVMLEVRMPTETMRLFFQVTHFKEFVTAANLALQQAENDA